MAGMWRGQDSYFENLFFIRAPTFRILRASTYMVPVTNAAGLARFLALGRVLAQGFLYKKELVRHSSACL